MQILIIDDEVAVAEVLAKAVTSQGHDVILAHGGVEALARLGRKRPDAVFLDVAMPDMSGIEVLRRIRSSDRTLPVVLMTGHATDTDLEEARGLGIAEVVEKPLFLRSLGEALARLGAPQSGSRAGARSRSTLVNRPRRGTN